MEYLPYFQPPSLSMSSMEVQKQCPLARMLSSWVAFRGMGKLSPNPMLNPPEVTRKARFSKLLSGDYAVFGNWLHDFFERSAYSYADQHFGRESEDRAALYQEVLDNFELHWERSLNMTEQEFRSAQLLSRDKRPHWYTVHALERLRGRVICPEKDAADKQRRKEWIYAAAVVIRDHFFDLVSHSSPENWVMLEGKLVKKGLVKPKKKQSQEEARRESSRPDLWLNIDGQPIQAYFIIDFAYHELIDDVWKLVLLDLKTGKFREKHLEQLEYYGHWAYTKGMVKRPEDIVLRVAYPQDPQGQWVHEFPFSSEANQAAAKRLDDAARDLLSRFVPLTDKRATLKQLKMSFSQHEAKCLFAYGSYERTKQWPSRGPDARTAVKLLIEKLSPPELAEGLKRGLVRESREEKDVADPAEVDAALAKAEETAKVDPQATYEDINHLLLKQMIPAARFEESFLKSVSVAHLLLPLSTSFRENFADRWLDKEEKRQSKSGKKGKNEEPEFLNCLSCEYSLFCEPGKNAIRYF